jgi:hypothetical protein
MRIVFIPLLATVILASDMNAPARSSAVDLLTGFRRFVLNLDVDPPVPSSSSMADREVIYRMEAYLRVALSHIPRFVEVDYSLDTRPIPSLGMMMEECGSDLEQLFEALEGVHGATELTQGMRMANLVGVLVG